MGQTGEKRRGGPGIYRLTFAATAQGGGGAAEMSCWNWSSSSRETPSYFAFSHLEPGFSPATTKLVFLETLEETLPPKARMVSPA